MMDAATKMGQKVVVEEEGTDVTLAATPAVEPATTEITEEHTDEGASPVEVPVTVDFHVGQVNIPVSELSGLSRGMVLTELDGMVFPRVRAVAGGKVFAEGELVEVDGRIGFRVLRVQRAEEEGWKG